MQVLVFLLWFEFGMQARVSAFLHSTDILLPIITPILYLILESNGVIFIQACFAK